MRLLPIWSRPILQYVAREYVAWDKLNGRDSVCLGGCTRSKSFALLDVSLGTTGAPGPVINLNAEVYYPPYLYDSSGNPAVRPTISAVSPQSLNPGGTLSITVGPTDRISRLTFIRTGSSTHSNNSDQRFITLSFSQNGQNVVATLPPGAITLVPGYYMVFAFNTAGVPSVAPIVEVL